MRPKSENDCVNALSKLERGELEDWHGLPEHCGPTAIPPSFTGGETEGRGLLSGNPTRFRVYQTAAQAEVIHAWIDDAGDVFLITIKFPNISGGAQQLLQRLGEPEKKLGPEAGRAGHQWIYASRGLTLYVHESTGEIAQVSVYRATTVEYYEQWLGAKDQKRYWPRSR